MKSSFKHANQKQSLCEMLARCQGAYSEKTLSGYHNDLLQFQAWCSARDMTWVPAPPNALADFIDDQARSKSIATIKRRVEAIKFAYRMLDLPCPAYHSAVRLALRRASRLKTARPRQSLGLTCNLLVKILAACPDNLAGRRDAALISVGYDTLCRSVELAAMRVEHLAPDLSTILVPRSKADPFGDGRIAYLSDMTQSHLRKWLEASKLDCGRLFQGLHTRKLSGEIMHTASIRRIIKRAAQNADLHAAETAGLSGHSMRIGAAQDMMVAGIDQVAIMQAGGWKSVNVLARYVENACAQRVHERRWERLGQ